MQVFAEKVKDGGRSDQTITDGGLCIDSDPEAMREMRALLDESYGSFTEIPIKSASSKETEGRGLP